MLSSCGAVICVIVFVCTGENNGQNTDCMPTCRLNAEISDLTGTERQSEKEKEAWKGKRTHTHYARR